MGQTFFVIQRKRADGKKLVELEKGGGDYYLERGSAEYVLRHKPDREFYEVVELVAETRRDWDLLMSHGPAP